MVVLVPSPAFPLPASPVTFSLSSAHLLQDLLLGHEQSWKSSAGSLDGVPR